jgi:hypothetical protein
MSLNFQIATRLAAKPVSPKPLSPEIAEELGLLASLAQKASRPCQK